MKIRIAKKVFRRALAEYAERHGITLERHELFSLLFFSHVEQRPARFRYRGSTAQRAGARIARWATPATLVADGNPVLVAFEIDTIRETEPFGSDWSRRARDSGSDKLIASARRRARELDRIEEEASRDKR